MTTQLNLDLPIDSARDAEVVPGWLARRVLGLYGTLTRAQVQETYRAHLAGISGRDPRFAEHVQYLKACRDALLVCP